jgi:predicted GNAT family acetyltransferase
MDDVDAAGAVPIANNTVTHRFEARFPEGVAVLRYHHDGAGSLVLDHTEVPAPLRHRGIATRLARTALEFARDHQVVVVPVCPFVVAYLHQHPISHGRHVDEHLDGGNPFRTFVRKVSRIFQASTGLRHNLDESSLLLMVFSTRL